MFNHFSRLLGSPDPRLLALSDEYAAGTDWTLSGPVNDAYEFTEWLRKLKHPTEPRIIAFVSPLNATCFHSSVEAKLATKDNLYHAIRDPNTIDACKENILIIFWGGHGVLPKTQLVDSLRRRNIKR